MPDTRAQLAHRRDGSALKIKTKTRLGRHKVMDSRTTGPAAKLPLRQPGRRNQQRRHSDPVRWVTLTTFRDVPWNAPYYQRLGFEVIQPTEWGPQLTDLVRVEQSRIPGHHPRVAMRRETGD
jgi:hypothetical protein